MIVLTPVNQREFSPSSTAGQLQPHDNYCNYPHSLTVHRAAQRPNIRTGNWPDCPHQAHNTFEKPTVKNYQSEEKNKKNFLVITVIDDNDCSN